MSFKDKVKIALIEKGWSQRELARQMNISHGYLQDLLNGSRDTKIRIEQIETLLNMEKQNT